MGTKTAQVNGKDLVLDETSRKISSRTFVPAAFMAESIGADAVWDAGKNTVVGNDSFLMFGLALLLLIFVLNKYLNAVSYGFIFSTNIFVIHK